MRAYYRDTEDNEVYMREGRANVSNMDRLMERFPCIERITESEYNELKEI